MHVTTDECEGFKSSFIKFHPPVTAGVAGGWIRAWEWLFT